MELSCKAGGKKRQALRFTREKALLMCYANMRREITLELVEQRIQDAFDAPETARGGVPHLGPGGAALRHYTVREVAARYGVHESTIRRDITVGKLRVKRIRGTIRIAEDALEAYERLTESPSTKP